MTKTKIIRIDISRRRIIGIMFVLTITTSSSMRSYCYQVGCYGLNHQNNVKRNILTRATIIQSRISSNNNIRQNQQRRRKYHCSSLLLNTHDSNNNDSNKNDSSNNNIYQQKHDQLMQSSLVSVAPMMDYTDRHFRHLIRLVSSQVLLYTEMIPANALARERQSSMERYMNDNNVNTMEDAISNYDATYIHRFIGQGMVHPQEGSSVLQLGGSDPTQLYDATKCLMELSQRSSNNNNNNNAYNCDYTALNLNCGCPSPKVANQGCFGAALMDEPELVAQLTKSISDGCQGQLPVTVKCRIGTDTHIESSSTNGGFYKYNEEEEYQRLCHFIETVASGGIVTDFQVHARIAVLRKSYSPAENRKIPPLKYHVIERLIDDYPHLTFSLNGGIQSIPEIQRLYEASPKLKGIMIGRAFIADPWRFAMLDELVYNNDQQPRLCNNRYEILEHYGKHADYEEENCSDPKKIRRFIIKAITQLFAGEPNSKQYRIELDTVVRQLSYAADNDSQKVKVSELIQTAALKHLSEETLLRTPQQSYERILWEEEKQTKQQQQQLFVSNFNGNANNNQLSLETNNSNNVISRSQQIIDDWQIQRKIEENEIH